MIQSRYIRIVSLVLLLLFCTNDNGLAFTVLHSTTAFLPSIKSIQNRNVQNHSPLFSTTTAGSNTINDKQEQQHTLKNLNVIIVGGGPSGLLLAHGLVSVGATVTVYEKRTRPSNLELEKRAYALGIGRRGRTAIHNIDTIVPSVQSSVSSLWESIKQRGYGSERFILDIGPFTIKLRDGVDVDSTTNDTTVEPSLLLYQSDLCRTLADELDARYKNTGRIKLKFNTAVSYIDLLSKTITTSSSAGASTSIRTKTNNPFLTIEEVQQQKYDLLIGCDGVNSIVRESLQSFYDNSIDSSTSQEIHDEVMSPLFQSKQEKIPGYFKVVRLPIVPPLVDSTAVQLLFPKKGSTTCFIEPTSKGRSCLLFAGRNTSTDILLSSSTTSTTTNTMSISDIEETLVQQYPKLIGNITTISTGSDNSIAAGTTTTATSIISTIAKQLYEQEPAQASTIQCNTYHCPKTYIALVGDAAHATGGVSGQGVNSALQDSYTLVQSLINTFQQQQQQQQQQNKNSKEQLIQQSLLQYSQISVPEGKALYDLSFGPNNNNGIIKKVRYSVKSIIDTVFKGKYNIGQKPLQTLLTISNESFSSIRRNRNKYYSDHFPTDETFQTTISTIHKDMLLFGQQQEQNNNNNNKPSTTVSKSGSDNGNISSASTSSDTGSTTVMNSITNSTPLDTNISSPVDIAITNNDIRSSTTSTGSTSSSNSISTSNTLKELLNGNVFVKFSSSSSSKSGNSRKGTLKQLLGKTEFIKF